MYTYEGEYEGEEYCEHCGCRVDPKYAVYEEGLVFCDEDCEGEYCDEQ